MAAPAGNQFRMSLTNSNEGGVLNVAQFGIETDSSVTLSVAQQTAQIIAYVVAARGAFLASGTLITRMQYRAHGSGGFLDVPFPDTEYNDLEALNTPQLTPMHDYGDTVLGVSGGLAPVGTSVCMTEYTNVFGRKGRGRHFLPFVAKTKVDGAGLFDGTSAGIVQDAYNNYILNTVALFGTTTLLPVVLSTTSSTQLGITNVKAQPVLSNLRSRRR